MELTKQKAIEEHRKMWNWIADQYENGCVGDIHAMKEEYIEETEYRECMLHDCFCCEYATQKQQKRSRAHGCLDCPAIWGTEVYSEFFPCEHFLSAYQKLKSESCKFDKCDVNSELCARFAREIANLPEKECV